MSRWISGDTGWSTLGLPVAILLKAQGRCGESGQGDVSSPVLSDRSVHQ